MTFLLPFFGNYMFSREIVVKILVPFASNVHRWFTPIAFKRHDLCAPAALADPISAKDLCALNNH